MSPNGQLQLLTLAVTPVGRPVTVKFTGAFGPAVRKPRTVVEAATVPEVGRATVPVVGLAVTEKLNGASAWTLIESCRWAVCPWLSRTRTVNVCVPAVVGVPLITPPLLRLNPGGVLPLASDHV